MYDPHFYIEEKKLLFVETYDRKYINIVNCRNFFLTEVEEMKSCIYAVETAKAEM